MRLFIAIALPDDIRESLSQIQNKLKLSGITGSWKPQQSLHSTIEFLGEVPNDSESVISRIIDSVAPHYQQFSIDIGGINAFPSFTRPHTIWVGITDENSHLYSLHNEVRQKLIDVGLKWLSSPFKPHITLLSRPKHIGISIPDLQIDNPSKMIVSELVLFESKVIEGKRTYVELHKAFLSV